jgi:DNA topoisomerase-2
MTPENITVTQRSIEDFLNTEVKEFAHYVIRTRAMPNLMDGLRIGARKILWAAINGDLSKKDKIKLPSLIGDTMKLEYNHGDASLMNTIVQLGSKHIYRYTPIEVLGQIGSLRIPDCDTAPRYLYVKKTPYLDFFKTDMELIDFVIDEGQKLEPKYFLPIIPISLLWRTNSPGFGFSYRSFSYNFDSLIDNCIKAIIKGSCNSDTDEIPLIPFVEGIKPENIIFNANKNSWYSVGEYSINLDTDQVIISDLPYNVSLDKYDAHLQSLLEKNYITSFTDAGMDGKIRYVLQFSRGRLKLISSDLWKFFKTLKLFTKVHKDTLNVIDEDGKTILFFETPYELIDAFVKRRLNFYQKRKVRTIAILKEKIFVLTNRIRFINLVTNDELIISKRKIVDIKKDLERLKIPFDVLKINIDKLTKDEIENLEKEISDLKAYLLYIEKTPIQEMYINDLVDLKKQHSEIKKIK